MKSNNFNIEKVIDALKNHGSTNFITQKELMSVKGKLNKNEYNVYYPYEDCSKVVLYKNSIPDLRLLKIESHNLRHQDVMGAVFSLGLKEDTFGDIVKYQGDFYVFILPHLVDYLKYNLPEIKNEKVLIEEIDIDVANNFKQEYVLKEYIVSSLRIDNVISTITNESRNMVLDHFKNKEVVLNYEEEFKPTRTLREGDTFSIRKYGKYKFDSIKKDTKKGGHIIIIKKYI